MIEHDGCRQPLQDIFDLHDLIAEHVDLHMPTQIVHALREGFEHLDRRSACLHQIEANSTYAESCQSLQLGIRNRRIDHCHGAGCRPDDASLVGRRALW